MSSDSGLTAANLSKRASAAGDKAVGFAKNKKTKTFGMWFVLSTTLLFFALLGVKPKMLRTTGKDGNVGAAPSWQKTGAAATLLGAAIALAAVQLSSKNKKEQA